jgi:hypothetical protein
MFKEEVKQTKEEIVIKVSIKERKYAIEEKLIYSKDPMRLIPEELLDKVKLISKPSKSISNMNKKKHTNIGEWVYEIIIENKKPVRKRQPKKPRLTNKKTLTLSDKSGNINNRSNKIEP